MGKLLRLLILLTLAGTAQAEQVKGFGDLSVHYIALNSTSVPANVAADYDLDRGENVALINIAGRRESGEPGDTTPVPLAVKGTVRNLLGQTITLTFQEVREPGAIYYLATTRFTDREALRFELTVEDLERGERHPLSFQKTLWAQ
ncbi:MAG: DUF4426 domain-containing protein [Pseudomonadales bacterium]|jgi:hypothetical protein